MIDPVVIKMPVRDYYEQFYCSHELCPRENGTTPQKSDTNIPDKIDNLKSYIIIKKTKFII